MPPRPLGWYARRVRRGTLTVALALAVAMAALPGDSLRAQDAPPALGTPAVHEALDRAAILLAKKARPELVDAIFAKERELGRPDADVKKPRTVCDKLLKFAKPSTGPVPDAAKAVREAAAALASTLPERKGDERVAVAAVVLALDSDVEPAHLALGHEKIDGRWLPAVIAGVLPRRAAIQDALREARRLEIEVTVEEGADPILEQVYGRKGVRARWHRVALTSCTMSGEKLSRIVREAIRASTYAQWLRTGSWEDLRLPAVPLKFVLLETEKDYRAAIDLAASNGLLDEKHADRARKLNSCYIAGSLVTHGQTEAHLSSLLLYYVHSTSWLTSMGKDPQPPFEAGMLGWLNLTFFGVPPARVTWIETTTDRQKTADRRDAFTTEWIRVGDAGIAGTRAYLRHLAQRGEDPPFARSIVDQMGKISGEDLFKCVLVFEYLLETDAFLDVHRATAELPPEPATFEAAFRSTLAEFDERWREWITAAQTPPGLAQTIDGAPAPGAPPVDPVAQRALEYLRTLRAAAFRKVRRVVSTDVSFDPDLCEGCKLHTAYLAKHREQLSAWPDAHEEYPDKEGFTTEGARAGLASVIVGPGVSSPEDAIDGWMGTFYHRLPLIDPGLVRIGWSLQHGIAALDSGSMVAPFEFPAYVPWPAAGATDVPTRFSGPELPHPVPGEDQMRWGYPVTVQTFAYEAEPDVKLALWQGQPQDGLPVECWFSTPLKPTNPKLAPANAFCLIPKARLKPGTLYTVVAEGIPERTRVTWTFTTGKE